VPVQPSAPPPTVPVPPVPPAPPPGFAAPPPGGAPPSVPPPYVAGPPPAGGGKGGKGPLIGLALLVVAALLVGSFVLFGGGDDDDAGGGDDAIVLEPIGLTLADDFAGNLDLDTPGGSLAVALPDVPPLGAGVAAALAGREADGDEPGLYGGSRDVAVCDVEQLIDFLTDEDNADKAEAWAEVQGIDVDGIEDFIEDLTPVRLRFDTRVTNHGFRDGRANPIQSILEAGTAVLVDDTGVPRVKCNCGNPLAEPADFDGDDDEALDIEPQNPEDAWDGFDPETVVVINEGDTINIFVLLDLDTGDLFSREVGSNGDGDGDVDVGELGDLCEKLGASPTCGEQPPESTTTTAGDTTTTTAGSTTSSIVLGTGDVQVTLRWPSDADLDLVVVDPNGNEASRSSSTPEGGQLDVDSNIGCQNDGSVENVFWPEGAAPAGAYTVIVEGFQVDGCGGGAYDITVQVTGQPDQTFSGNVPEDGESSHTFTVG
jgi:hypothetical protein